MNNLRHTLKICALMTAASAIVLQTSCREKGIVQHFRTPKAKEATPPPNPDAGQETTSKAPYSWTLPDGWTAKPASGMRLATINIPSSSGLLDASVTEFGGDLAGNVNRWRGQIGLASLPEADIAATLTQVETGLGKGYIVALTNPESPDKALLAAIITRPTNTSVFIKITGAAAELEKIKPAFTSFTQSLSPSSN